MRLVDTFHKSQQHRRFSSSFHARALTTVSVLALAAYSTVGAQQVRAAEQEAQAGVEEVVVTGSRIVREGYEAPTPLAVIGSEALASQSGSNVSDYLQTMPVFSGNVTPNTNQAGISAGTAGVSTLSLRGLGAARSLILLDGQRSVGSLLNQNVDISNFPQQLIERVDVVTGGASAVYGSDAVAGVANFILDKKFTGIKGEVSGGMTTYGDDESYRVALSGGFNFGGGRGHILLSADLDRKYGVIDGANGRAWANEGWGTIINPAYSSTTNSSVPQNLVFSHVGQATATPGGIITSGPLKGTAFGPDGIPFQLNYGDLVNGNYFHGGDWKLTQVAPTRGNSVDPAELRHNVFFRSAYDITDDINVFVQASWGAATVLDQCCTQFQQGNQGVVKSDNAFIPASVKAQMTALGVTSLTMGSMNFDLPSFGANSERFVNRYVAGANGKFDAFGKGWAWNAYFQYGKARNSVNTYGDGGRSEFTKAIDAVVAPAGVVGLTPGSIVCRVRLTTPSDPCQPYNQFGTGVNTQAAINYIIGDSHMNADLVEAVYDASLTGEPFEIWAGPVSIALNVDHRLEKTYGVSDPDSVATDWFAGNYKAITGQYSVTEGALETVIPIAKGQSWADSWDINAAARITDYTTSGRVVTWKAGTTYSPIPDIKIRVTRSRDIRAGNLQELYAVGTSSQGSIVDPFGSPGPKQIAGATPNPTVRGFQVGNQTLLPEKADTTGIGVVLQPSFLPGFAASVDYWSIDLKGGIANVGTQATINLCFNGNQTFCSPITRVNGIVTNIVTTSYNLASEDTRGIDLEGSYRWAADDMIAGMGGNFSMHANATIYLKDLNNSGLVGAVSQDTVGQGSLRDWKINATLSYDANPWKASVTARVMPSGWINTNYVQCTTGCPVSTADHPTISNNSIPGAFYLDTTLSYKFMAIEGVDSELFFNIKNLLDTDPGIVPILANGAFYYAHPTNFGAYDGMGRIWRAGLRFKM